MRQRPSNILELLHCRHPIVGAPMANVSGGKLAAATSISGGFGFIGAGYSTPKELQTELDLARTELENAPFNSDPKENSGLLAIGVGFITWTLRNKPGVLDVAIEARPLAFWFSFGDYRPYVSQVRKKIPDTVIMVQVDNVADAMIASSDDNVDVLVLQGLEAGGHGPKDGTTTFCLVPEVAEKLSTDGPLLLAAGGVSGWRHLAGALNMGAHGVVLGTRLCVATESLLHPKAKEMIVHADEGGRSTITTPQIDKLRGEPWDLERYTARALKNSVFNDPPKDITSEEYRKANLRLDFNVKAVFAGLGVGSINSIEPAGKIITGIISQYYFNYVKTQQKTVWVPKEKL